MAEDRKFGGKLDVWLTNTYTTPKDILARYARGESESAFGSLCFSAGNLSSLEGWSKVGTCEFTAEFFTDDVILQGMVGGLQKEIQKTRAEAQMKVEQLEERISQLLALPNPEKAAEVVPTVVNPFGEDDDTPF